MYNENNILLTWKRIKSVSGKLSITCHTLSEHQNDTLITKKLQLGESYNCFYPQISFEM